MPGTVERVVSCMYTWCHSRPSLRVSHCCIILNALSGAKLVPFTNGVYARVEDRPLLAVEPIGMSQEEVEAKLRTMYRQRYFGLVGMHAIALLVSLSACKSKPTRA